MDKRQCFLNRRAYKRRIQRRKPKSRRGNCYYGDHTPAGLYPWRNLPFDIIGRKTGITELFSHNHQSLIQNSCYSLKSLVLFL